MSSICARPLVGLATVVSILMFAAPAARADDVTSLDRERVIELARRSAPSVRIAASSVEQERAQLVGARVFARENPVLEAVVGPRWGDDTSIDVEATLAVPIELGGKRRKRVAAASAAIDRATAEQHAEEVDAISRALAAYYRALHAAAKLNLATERQQLASQLLQGVQTRHSEGDVAELEVNLAATEVARAESEVLAEEAETARMRGELAIVLGLDVDAIRVDGALDDRATFDRLAAPDVTGRADVVAAKAAIREAQSRVVRADAARFPDLTARLSYAREDGDIDILLAGLAVTLPLFDRGQGERQEARVLARRADLILDLTTRTATTEAEVAKAVYDANLAAVAKLESVALPLVARNEELAATAYQAGKADVSTVILVRRESIETRREHLDRQLEATLAGLELARSLGALP